MSKQIVNEPSSALPPRRAISARARALDVLGATRVRILESAGVEVITREEKEEIIRLRTRVVELEREREELIARCEDADAAVTEQLHAAGLNEEEIEEISERARELWRDSVTEQSQ